MSSAWHSTFWVTRPSSLEGYSFPTCAITRAGPAACYWICVTRTFSASPDGTTTGRYLCPDKYRKQDYPDDAKAELLRALKSKTDAIIHEVLYYMRLVPPVHLRKTCLVKCKT